MVNLDMILMTLPYSLSVITALINTSISTSTFPDIWKTALVKPLPKNASPTLFNEVLKFIEDNHILPKFQSGFRKQRSTNTALLDVVDNMLSSRDSGFATILVLLDFSRAFDSINTSLLLSKMAYYGFDLSTIKWFNSYLSVRSQKVVIERPDGSKINSIPVDLARGVPQGSILGPLLFIIYSSDIKSIITSKHHI